MNILSAALILSLPALPGSLGSAESPADPAPAPGPAAAIGPAEVIIDGGPAAPRSLDVAGFSLIARPSGPQVAVMGRPPALLAALRAGEEVVIGIPVRGIAGPCTLAAEASLASGLEAEVSISIEGGEVRREILRERALRIEIPLPGGAPPAMVRLKTAVKSGEAGVLWSKIRLVIDGKPLCLAAVAGERPDGPCPPPVFPEPRRPIEDALIEWDWRMQDGIGTEKSPSGFREAAALALVRGDALIGSLRAAGSNLGPDGERWPDLRLALEGLPPAAAPDDPGAERLWRKIHRAKRRMALLDPLARTGPVIFAKQAPGCFSHQLTQYYGRYARPGGGIFSLEEPGDSMRCRELARGLPPGSFQHPEVSWDGSRILFSFCEAPSDPQDTIQGHRGRYYHLHEVGADGSGLRQLTSGPFDDFSPRYLPDGRILFISTRRLGWHRCGAPGCENYTLAIAGADGSGARPISYHETQEWDPAVLDDGRIIYTRWDYVDRHAVYYEQLWTVRPDGSSPAAFYGNNTFNPVGIWESRQVPGSRLVMATAGAHHAMTAGSIILIDAARGVDGPGPVTRLTPDAPFPESEALLLPGWRGSVPVAPRELPPGAARWPGHCYRSPYPLSEGLFLAAYGFDPLVGEPKANRPNLFGLYLVDRWGNKELLYRDLDIASLWPMPLRARAQPPLPPSQGDPGDQREGTFFIQDVHLGVPPLPPGTVKRLRIIQVLPKSTPGANNPTVGLANASPGKQVLGTVGVEADGSAFFKAPAGVPLSFQALDGRGLAVQVMRSITYLQSGEAAACIGCHESRTTAPPPRPAALALARPPSVIEPGPDGSKPLSFPILVQPVLDRRCVSCHGGEKPAGDLRLGGEPEGRYTVSYNALAPRVPFSEWTGRADFLQANCEPLSLPGRFGSGGSALLKKLLEGHHDVVLDPGEVDRLATWMDANALFYGTFDPAAQARQLQGERIEGPGLE